MSVFLPVLILLLNGSLFRQEVHREDVQEIANLAFRSTDVTKFTEAYIRSGDTMYFRFAPSSVADGATRHAWQSIVVTPASGPPLLYNELQDETQKPVITFQMLQLTATEATVRLGFPVEGMVGKLTMVKDPAWRITQSEVYEI